MSFSDMLRRLSRDAGNNERIEDMIKQMCNSDRSSDEWLRMLSNQFSEESQNGHTGVTDYEEPSSPDSRSSKKYQATVEDGTDSEGDGGSKSSRQQFSRRKSVSSVLRSFESDSEDGSDLGLYSNSGHSRHHQYNDNGGRYPFSPSSSATSTIPTSPGSTSTSSKSVRFSNRGPPMAHQTGRSVDDARESRRYSYTAPQREFIAKDKMSDNTRHDTRKMRVDVKWGKLFDERGGPTERLKQVVFAVAHHLVTKYPPTDSLVIPPMKLKAFYARYAIDSETGPYQVMFTEDAPRSMSSLQSLYERLQCEFLLIPPHSGSTTPLIPALTPRGFNRWLSLFIESYPQREALRLSRLVAEVPLTAYPPSSPSAPSSPPERLPSNMSTSIFPSHGVDETRLLVEGALKKWERDLGLRPSFSYDRSSGSFSRRGSVPRMTSSCLSDFQTYSELQRGLDGSNVGRPGRHSGAHDAKSSQRSPSSKRCPATELRTFSRRRDASSEAHAHRRKLSISSAHPEEFADQDKHYRRSHHTPSEASRHSDKYRGRRNDRSPDVSSSRHKSRHTSERRSSPFSHPPDSYRTGNITPDSNSSFSSYSSRSLSPGRRSRTSSRHGSSDQGHKESTRRDREHHHRHHHRDEEERQRRRRDKDDHGHKSSKRKEGLRGCERERERIQSNSGRRRVR